jgi:carbonic anhydrase/acetyltransferase-like protein (isoleucine patch superfamily)
MVRSCRGARPRIDPTAFVDLSAQVIGDVAIGAENSVWMNAVRRGDVNAIRVGRRPNLQDGTIAHVMDGTHDTRVGDDVTVGHGAIVHGCTIGSHCLVGRGGGVEVGSESIVAAGNRLHDTT